MADGLPLCFPTHRTWTSAVQRVWRPALLSEFCSAAIYSLPTRENMAP